MNSRVLWWSWFCAGAMLLGLAVGEGQEVVKQAKPGTQAKATSSVERMLGEMRDSLEVIQRDVRDYTAKIAKRERTRGRLGDQELMLVKIRNRRSDEQGKVKTPFSVYLKNLEPKGTAGREAIYVENRNGGKIVAHETGFANLIRLHLDPRGSIAMQGRRHPITDIGVESLLQQLIERIGREAKQRKFETAFKAGEQVEGRACTLLELTNLEQQSPDDVRVLRLFIEEERKVPLRFAVYLWPEKPGGEARLDEEFTYRDLKLNVGLTDTDFDPDNPRYDYP